MAGQTRRTSGPRPQVSRAAQVSPPVVPIPPETPSVELDPEPVQSEPVEPSEPPPFDPDGPQPGQSIRGLVPHSGYTSFAYGQQSFRVDPDTDCIV